MVGRIGQLAEVALDDLAGFQRVRVMIGCLFSTGVSWARYLVVPDLVASVTFGSFRKFFTHLDSARVGTRYFTPSTSTGVTGTFCGCLLARMMTVSVSLWTAPVAIAIVLMILRLNHG
jgi:hypothetical protein